MPRPSPYHGMPVEEQQLVLWSAWTRQQSGVIQGSQCVRVLRLVMTKLKFESILKIIISAGSVVVAFQFFCICIVVFTQASDIRLNILAYLSEFATLTRCHSLLEAR